MRGRVLIVAGSDSGGGAGIQADIKAVTALGGFAMTAVTALTAQNTEGVFAIHAVPPDFVQQQMRLVLSDLGADCLKTGMLHSSELIRAVVDVIAADAADVKLVVDPVMVAKGGAPLLDPAALADLKRHLIARATIVTPNLPEAELLADLTIATMADRRRAAAAILALGAQAVLIKGGHGREDPLVDLLVEGDGKGGERATEFTSARLATRHTHGTGCTFGKGHGPLNHAVTVQG
ncbi:MAG: bifunctional hydroxymethylpyrimidine kinase/phosphomethylpyrimidine kinase [Proteobacteria bacterium]|nr:bifunctional hydroxymethylpyrimidine kinase/phosphomethylpyrimidine kinase [Pseudomonadota bacterium]